MSESKVTAVNQFEQVDSKQNGKFKFSTCLIKRLIEYLIQRSSPCFQWHPTDGRLVVWAHYISNLVNTINNSNTINNRNQFS